LLTDFAFYAEDKQKEVRKVGRWCQEKTYKYDGLSSFDRLLLFEAAPVAV